MQSGIQKNQQARHGHQFSLVQLLSFVAATALLLGLWRIFGAQNLVGVVAIGGLALPFAWRPRWLYTWLIPVIWTSIAWMNFHYPGDEYGGFGVGSLAGLWIVFVLPSMNSVHWMLPPLLLAGYITMTICGVVMDKLRVRWIPWFLLWLVAAISLFSWSFFSFESVERALAKNGSYAAYVLPSMNLGIYAATIIMVVCTGLYRLVQWARVRFAASRQHRS